jgi:hypothetical protein
MRKHVRILSTLTSGAVLVVVATGCASPSSAGSAGATDAPEIGAVNLSDACPSTIVVQTDWNPSSEHGHLYEMLGPDPVIDASSMTVSGGLYSGGEYTGVDLEIRAGGPAIGFQSVSTQLYADPAITLGYVQTDGQIFASADQPTVSVMAPLEVSPQIIMWDPASYPDVETIADLGKTDAVVRYYGGAPFMDYLIDSGSVRADKADGGYDGTPASFVASDGKDAQQGFASSEPYLYENEIAEWGKPVAYELVADAGYPNYTATMSVRTGDLGSLDACLTKLVPVMQQAEVDFYSDPSPVVDLILDAVDAYDNGIVYTRGAAEFGVSSVIADGLVSNGDDGAIGDFDPERMQRMLDIVTDMAAASGTDIEPGLTADDLYTNTYIDPAIGLPAQ